MKSFRWRPSLIRSLRAVERRFRPDYWIAPDIYDWQTGGRQLSEEERKIARRLVKADETSSQTRRGSKEAETLETSGE